MRAWGPDLRHIGQAPEPDAVLPGACGDELLRDDGHGRDGRQALRQAQEGSLQAGTATGLGRARTHLRGPVQHLQATEFFKSCFNNDNI